MRTPRTAEADSARQTAWADALSDAVTAGLNELQAIHMNRVAVVDNTDRHDGLLRRRSSRTGSQAQLASRNRAVRA